MATREHEPALLEPLDERRLHLVAMAEPLADRRLLAVEKTRQAARRDRNILGSQTHRPALFTDLHLIRHQTDHLPRRISFKLAGNSIFNSANVTSKLHYGALQTEADAKKRHFVQSGIADAFQFSIYSPRTESIGNQNSGKIAQLALGRIAVDLLGIDIA
ncbi:MAG: hypothetical protein IID61_17710 [SAR324 cluster bacterium]|nr:hypothetical protein [SAR324 cluster bacterium]